MKENGYSSEVVSVGYEHHEVLKELLTTGRVDIYNDRQALWELKGLEDKGSKVEHAPGFFKDEADALAGAVFCCMNGIGAKPVVKPRARRGAAANKGLSGMGTYGGGRSTSWRDGNSGIWRQG